ncbi:glycoprotein-N-acetylgalactosamine 3-beta-galactosyltransferase 1 isoform X2 [Eurytemora carolleeae]|uniref:glycoprotein-N-acetylgalactosamine 3-beta-galactosyltransferase 1 isoform X2 n=1 Tax=Eurytemora carolleeae TaxID=1294199 RepID=UPI000C775CB6|nr:glycoprotein-N-acetylgalactosamine 3-beta-galactosyltransferase 1 isoform X2 [Eurytemora carolleeae]|eukprot:XP_023323027.1 glycoprotein-N-acetylgalactosamine 3-beta-galactosyltransferase 1-like isoform X2 [Eurytemora affinis]
MHRILVMDKDFSKEMALSYKSALNWNTEQESTVSALENPADIKEDEDEEEEEEEEDVEDDTESNKTYRYHLSNKFHKFKVNQSPVRLLCLVLTQPAAHLRAQAVFDTWGSRCTLLYFLSTKSEEGDHGLPVLHNPAKENYQNLWSKTKYGFQFAFDHLLDQVDWVMKADDDTYVIMENLHNMLAQHDPEFPTFFGQHFGVIVDQGYMSGGSGYILSRKAVELVVTKAFTNSSLCRGQDDGTEDVEMGVCLSNIGVHPSSSRDQKRDEETFFPVHVWHMMTVENTSWVYSYMSKKPETGFDCCSERAISFHYITPEGMYETEYLIYKLKLFDMTDIRENVEKRINQLLTTSSIQLNTTQEIETETGNRKQKTGNNKQESGNRK